MRGFPPLPGKGTQGHNDEQRQNDERGGLGGYDFDEFLPEGRAGQRARLEELVQTARHEFGDQDEEDEKSCILQNGPGPNGVIEGFKRFIDEFVAGKA